MKSFSIFESTIIGFFVGVVVSTYIAFIDSIGGYLGQILSLVSLRPILILLISPQNQSIVMTFLLVVAVYTFYGLIAGYILRKSSKAKFTIPIVITFLVIVIFIQQKAGSSQTLVAQEVSYSKVEISPKSVSKVIEQYFGNEVVGDLDDDGKNDVAFIISRNDKERGVLYYLSTALTVDSGHTGTNLIYIGEKLKLENISIDHGIIGVSYLDRADNQSKIFYAKVNNGTLEAITVADNGDSLSWGEIVNNGKMRTLKLCDRSDVLLLIASSSVLKNIDVASKNTASTSQGTSTILGALIGKVVDSPAKESDISYKLEFLATDIITFMPNGICP